MMFITPDLLMAVILETAVSPALAPPTVTEIIMGLGTLFSMALNYRFAASVAGIRLEIKTESGLLRDDLLRRLDSIRSEFVPEKSDMERRDGFAKQFEKCNTEIDKNRDRLHDMSSKFETLLLGPMNQVHVANQDLGRRIATLEERSRFFEERLRDSEDRTSEIERIRSH